MSQTRYPNALYAHLMVKSLAVSAESGHSLLPLGPHLRHGGGLHIAALGLTAEHGAGAFALTDVSAVPISIAMSQRNIPADLPELELVSRLRHRGRTIMVTTTEAFRPADRFDRLAFGVITWSVLPPVPKTAIDGVTPRAGTHTLAQLVGIESDGESTRLNALDADLLGPGGVVHAGALQTLAEQSALDEVRRRDPDRPAAVADATFHFVRAARRGPFVATARVHSGTDVDVDVVDDGGRGRPCVIANFRVDVSKETA